MERIDVMFEPLRALLLLLGAFVPRLLLAAVVLLIGVLLAKAARFGVRRALRAINFHVVTRRAGLDDLLLKGGSEGDSSDLFAAIVYWAVILAALIVAFNGLGLAQVTDLLGRVMLFVPRLIVALLMVAFGSYFARFIGNAVGGLDPRADRRYVPTLALVVRYAVIGFVLIVAIDHLDIGGDIVRLSFLIVLGGAVFAIALAVGLAFGLGGREWASAQLEHWWPAPKNDRLP